MKRLFISQPFTESHEKAVEISRKALEKTKRYMNDENVRNVDTLVRGKETGTDALFFLGQRLMNLSSADAAYFAQGWKNDAECRIEHLCAEKYGIELIIEDSGHIKTADEMFRNMEYIKVYDSEGFVTYLRESGLKKEIKAHWIYDSDRCFGFDSPEWTCSNCGYKCGEGMNTSRPTEYCPGCGATMEEDKNAAD